MVFNWIKDLLSEVNRLNKMYVLNASLKEMINDAVTMFLLGITMTLGLTLVILPAIISNILYSVYCKIKHIVGNNNGHGYYISPKDCLLIFIVGIPVLITAPIWIPIYAIYKYLKGE